MALFATETWTMRRRLLLTIGDHPGGLPADKRLLAMA